MGTLGIMKRIMGVAAVLALAACSAPAPTPAPTLAPATDTSFEVAGVVRVELDYISMGHQGLTAVGGPCITDPGYKDMREGAAVVVTDGSGTTVGKGALGPAVLAVTSDATNLLDGWCELPFSVDATAGLDFYRVKVGARDPLDFSEEELADGGTILTIGSVRG